MNYMKKNLLKGMMFSAFAMLSMSAFAQTTVTIQPTADTWIRLNNKTNQAAAVNMELQTYTNEADASKSQSMLGLMSFEIPADALADDVTITKASLRLVAKRVKGDRMVNVYKYTAFEENTVYGTEADNVAASMVDDNLLTTFKAEGKAGADITTDEIVNTAFTNIAKWTTNVDMTDALKGLSDGKLNILLAKQKDEAKSTQIFTKDAKDFENTKNTDTPIAFAAADLVPQLTIVYTKKETTGVENVEVTVAADKDAHVYNLQGVRMNAENLPAGIYIKGGKKFVVK